MESKLILKRAAVAALIFAGLATALVLVGRGDIAKTQPLKGWKWVGSMPSATLISLRNWTNCTIRSAAGGILTPSECKAISDDYHDFVQKLPTHKDRWGGYNERDFIEEVSVFKDRTDQHAVQISMPMDGKFLYYILIYDNSNKRTKMIKYSAGHYSS